MPAPTRLAASIFGTMLYPLEEGHRRQRIAAAHAIALRHKAELGGTLQHGVDRWRDESIATRAQLAQVFQFLELSSWEEALSQWSRGMVAGELLSLIVWMSIHEPGAASLKRGVFLAEQIYRFPSEGTSPSRRLSQKTIKRIWSDFWPVSHLWAGFAEVCRGHEKVAAAKGDPVSAGTQTAFLSQMTDPGPTIAYAMNYLRYAANLVPSGKKPATPIIRWPQAWLPPQAAIPKDQPDFFDPAKLYTGLSERAARVLATYRHG